MASLARPQSPRPCSHTAKTQLRASPPSAVAGSSIRGDDASAGKENRWRQRGADDGATELTTRAGASPKQRPSSDHHNGSVFY
jgi:hypothetical protein